METGAVPLQRKSTKQPHPHHTTSSSSSTTTTHLRKHTRSGKKKVSRKHGDARAQSLELYIRCRPPVPALARSLSPSPITQPELLSTVNPPPLSPHPHYNPVLLSTNEAIVFLFFSFFGERGRLDQGRRPIYIGNQGVGKGLKRIIMSSCNGCRALRKGCSDSCILRACLDWIPSPHAQSHATLFVARFFGRSDLLSFVSSVPLPQRAGLPLSLSSTLFLFFLNFFSSSPFN